MKAQRLLVKCGLNPHHPSSEEVILVPRAGIVIRRSESDIKARWDDGELDVIDTRGEIRLPDSLVRAFVRELRAHDRAYELARELRVFSSPLTV